MKTLIEFKNVKKHYQVGEVQIEALKGIDFTINEGEFVVILGASGAGKSTILNLLGGMDKVTSGDIIVSDENIADYNDKKLTLFRREKVGFIFQFYNLINNLNALENVEFASAIKKQSLSSKEVLDKVGLSERIYNFPSQLSGGEQQRVAIARAVAKNPLLLLCDEPTGALDDETGRSVLGLLQTLNKDMGTTIVLITHNVAIAQMANKVIHVRNGLIDDIQYARVGKDISEITW